MRFQLGFNKLVWVLLSVCSLETVGVARVASGQGPVSSGAVQSTNEPLPNGVVTGRVVFADTNGPARFAKVLLKSAVAASGSDDLLAELQKNQSKGKTLSAADQAEMKQQMAASAQMLSAISDLLVSTTVGADGVYLFTNVKPGTYYVHAIAPGYIDPLAAFSAEDLASRDPAVKQRIAAVAALITVSGTDQTHADLRLERGAAISGRVLYDDGTPAVGWTVRTVHQAAASATSSFGAMGLDASDMDLSHLTEVAQTDDTGHYRIAGLSTGEYMLQARFSGAAIGHSSFNPTLTNSGSPFGGGAMAALLGLRLTVYSGNALRLPDARPVSVRAGEDVNGYDLTMPIHALHAVTGTVLARTDGHPVSGGSVELTAQGADGKEDPSLHLVGVVGGDGAFHLDYVPGGVTYTLKVVHAVDATTISTKRMLGSLIAEQKTTHSYGPLTQSLIVGDSDVTALRLYVPETPAAATSN